MGLAGFIWVFLKHAYETKWQQYIALTIYTRNLISNNPIFVVSMAVYSKECASVHQARPRTEVPCVLLSISVYYLYRNYAQLISGNF